MVNTQSPKIAIRIRLGVGVVEQQAGERLGEAAGRCARPTVVVQRSEAKAVFTTWSGTSSAW